MNAGPDQARNGGSDISPETVATTLITAAEASGVQVSEGVGFGAAASEPDAVDLATEALDPDLVQAGRSLLLGPVSFVMGAASLHDLPPDELPEIAFAGRSNVGKSSLINALTERGNLARVSNTPGRTQQLNFFRFADRMMIGDMPGYGYAEAPKAMVKAWQKMVFSYLRGRSNLARVYVLIDGRHGVKKNDHEVFKLLDDTAVSYQVVMTKADKEKAPVLTKRFQAIETELRRHVAAYPEVIVTSSRKMRGMETLRTAIARLLLENNQGG